MSAEGGDFLAGFSGALDEEPAVGEEVGAYTAEVASGTELAGPLEGGDEVALEEVCACGEGDGVWDGAFEVGGGCCEEVEGFGDGGGLGGGEEEDEGFDGGDGHG